MDCGITIEADQATSKKYGYKGVVRSGALYEKMKNLKEGDKVIFSADVIDATDNTEKTGLNLSTLIHLKITDIKAVADFVCIATPLALGFSLDR